MEYALAPLFPLIHVLLFDSVQIFTSLQIELVIVLILFKWSDGRTNWRMREKEGKIENTEGTESRGNTLKQTFALHSTEAALLVIWPKCIVIHLVQ